MKLSRRPIRHESAAERRRRVFKPNVRDDRPGALILDSAQEFDSINEIGDGAGLDADGVKAAAANVVGVIDVRAGGCSEHQSDGTGGAAFRLAIDEVVVLPATVDVVLAVAFGH